MYPSHGNPGNTTSSSSGLRQPSHSHSHSQSLLQTRIAAKRAELENLRALRDLSANLATQLSTLEEKLGTLRDGSQSVALVLANWENVLRAINMAASRYFPKEHHHHILERFTAMTLAFQTVLLAPRVRSGLSRDFKHV